MIVTARDEICRFQSDIWLRTYGIEYEEMFMRKLKDNRKDAIVKEEILKDIQSKYTILAVFDDRQQVVDMWRKHRIPCFQVAPDPTIDPEGGRRPFNGRNFRGKDR